MGGSHPLLVHPSCCQVSHGAIQFMVYEELKKATGSYNSWRSPSQSASDSAALASLQISLIGAASKLAATVTTYPLQVWSGACTDTQTLP